jgi:hypothetical protein
MVEGNGNNKKTEATSSTWQERLQATLAKIAAEAIVAALAAIGGAVFLYFEKNPVVPWWVLLIVAVTILSAYFSLFFIEFLFRPEFSLTRRLRVHFILLAILVAMVTVPLALLQSFTKARTNELQASHDAREKALLAQNQDLDRSLKAAQRDQTSANSRRIQLYSQVTGSLTKTLQHASLDPPTLYDLLHFCVESIALSKSLEQQSGLRAAVVYLDQTGKYLVVPNDRAYYGYGLDQDITKLYFTVSKQPDNDGGEEEDPAKLGVAGWCFLHRKPVRDDDVQTPKPGEEWRYKPDPASQKDQPDHAMICVGVPDLTDPAGHRYVGVLSVSSVKPGVFTANDLAVAGFFATLLARFQTPARTPDFLRPGAKSHPKEALNERHSRRHA